MDIATPNRPSGLDEYLKKVQMNISGPKPFCIELADDLLMKCANNLHENLHVTSARLFQIGFGSWRSAILLTLAGATSQVPAVLRHALECACYSFLCANDESFAQTWWDREVSESARKSLKGRNSPMAKARELLKSRNLPLHKQVKQTYDHLIDFGAHPNVLIFADHMDEGDESGIYTTKLLGSGEARSSAHVTSSGVALEMLLLFRETWPVRFGHDLETKLIELKGQSNLFFNSNLAQQESE